MTMSEAKYTSGPWAAREYASPVNTYYITGPNGKMIGRSYNKADAALIASAPDLLAEVYRFRDFLDGAPHGDNCFVSNHYDSDPGNRCNCGKDEARQFVDAAIKKATP